MPSAKKRRPLDNHRNPLLGLRMDPDVVKEAKKASIDHDLALHEWVEELIRRELQEKSVLRELSRRRR